MIRSVEREHDNECALAGERYSITSPGEVIVSWSEEEQRQSLEMFIFRLRCRIDKRPYFGQSIDFIPFLGVNFIFLNTHF